MAARISNFLRFLFCSCAALRNSEFPDSTSTDAFSIEPSMVSKKAIFTQNLFNTDLNLNELKYKSESTYCFSLSMNQSAQFSHDLINI